MKTKTTFGKYLAKLRIDNDEKLKDMACKLKVSPSFLSNVETGKKMFPGRFVSEIAVLYNLNNEQKIELLDVIMSNYEQYRRTYRTSQSD